MPNNKIAGDFGENEVVELVPCPNCGKKLMTLPKNFPLFDIQCTGCMFRAQVKTANSAPRASIFGAGWRIYEKVSKAGYLAPPLIINFKWMTKEGFRQVIRFYPFISKANLRPYKLSPTARRANYHMFAYIRLDKIPHFEMYSQLDPNRKSI